jgi:CDP-diacylglycerol--glycerol-3-phosphate 3-phosphatidyltransferase
MRLGLRPNHVTVTGMLLTVGVGVALAAGPDNWRTWGIGLMVGAGACDLLDGAMAKLGGLRTRFGAVLDSTCDRVSDAALYLGPAFYFILRPEEAAGGRAAAPNLTLIMLCMAGFVWAYQISYIRSRADNEGVDGGGGFWQRPERIVTLLLGMAFLHLTTAMWILGTLPMATVVHRLCRVRRSCLAADAGAAMPVKVEGWPTGLAAVVLWRWPRGTPAFDVMAGAVVATVVFWSVPAADPLRDLVARWFGG